MPTYQYACTACGHRFEAVQSFSDASLSECPECSGRLRKLFGSVGVVFKGSGFYRTDSRSEAKSGAKSETKAETGATAAASSSSSSSSDSGKSAASSSTPKSSSSSTTSAGATAAAS